MAEVSGTVEDIIFKNKDNGYVVAKINNNETPVTIVGYIPYINEGQNIKVTGEWVIHPQFGQQLKVETCEELLPSTTSGIERYLSSGIISGIGPVTAKKIVEKFGEKTFDMMDNDITRLKEIEGIGDKKIALIYESYSKQREIKDIMVYLEAYGVTPGQCVKIYKKYGANSIKIVKEDPYILTEDISGIGFKTADKIARSLGVETNSPYRIQSGIKYVISQFCGLGNTYMPMEKLLKEGADILTVEQSEIEESIYKSAGEGKLNVDVVEGKKCVFTLPYYYCELGVTKYTFSYA